MFKELLKKLSYIVPVKIYAGKSTTITDAERAIDDRYERKLNSRTAKVTLKSYYTFYEISHVVTSDKEGKQYVLEHCYTGDKIKVNESVFELMFDKV